MTGAAQTEQKQASSKETLVSSSEATSSNWLKSTQTIYPFRHLEKVYCAGPLFNEAERMQMTQIADALTKAGFSVFLPHRDGLEFAKLEPLLESRGHPAKEVAAWLQQAIFDLDSYQVIVDCGSVVFNASGRVPDEGAVVEAACAYLASKPVIYFKFDDYRSLLHGSDNPLLTGLANFTTARDLNKLGDTLKTEIMRLNPASDHSVAVAPHIAERLARGATLWDKLQVLRTGTSPEERVDKLADLVVALYCAGKNAPNVGELSLDVSSVSNVAPPTSSTLDKAKASLNIEVVAEKEVAKTLLKDQRAVAVLRTLILTSDYQIKEAPLFRKIIEGRSSFAWVNSDDFLTMYTEMYIGVKANEIRECLAVLAEAGLLESCLEKGYRATPFADRYIRKSSYTSFSSSKSTYNQLRAQILKENLLLDDQGVS